MKGLRALAGTWKRPLVVASISFLLGLSVSAAAFGAYLAADGGGCSGRECEEVRAAPSASLPTVTATPVPPIPQTSSEQVDAPVSPAPTPNAVAPGAPPAGPADGVGPGGGQTQSNIAPASEPDPPPPAGNLPPCSGDCGAPRNFCDSWPGGFCTDYRHLGATTFEVPFPPAAEETSLDCLDATDPGYEPQMLGGSLPFPCGFSKFEHFMTRMESGSFGIAILRFRRPFDFAGRTGHVRFDIDLKGRTRNYTRLMLSPDLTKRGSDDRNGEDSYPEQFVELWFRGKVEGTICRIDGCVGDDYPYGDAFVSSWPEYYGVDNVRDSVDVYISRSHIKVVYNQGQPHERVMVDEPIPDIGFDRAYVYLSQVSYNPCKDGQCAPADQIMHWDNVAYDGPRLPVNGLTPRGSRDVVFNAYSATSCSVKGTPADPVGLPKEYTWVTWVARLPDDGSPVSAGDVSCSYTFVSDGSDVVRGFEVVAPH